MPRRLLIANRGEIALRIARSASLFPRPGTSDVSFVPLVLYTEAEASAAHVLHVPAPQRILLPGSGPRAYLDGKAIVRLAKENDAWGVAPGYGFLSESAEFASEVERNGLVWVGPRSEQLTLLSDKVSAKRLASQCDVPTLESTSGQAASLDDVRAFAATLEQKSNAKIIIKALSGGGGRGMRIVDLARGAKAVQEAYASCQREAEAAFGDGRVYAERFLSEARHIEVQIIGDGTGDVTHVWERECSLQRRHQKLVEIAPSPTLAGGADSPVRQKIIGAAVRMAEQTKYMSLGTFEFLLTPQTGEFFFMEVNPRMQVEHTITEAITSLDVVAIQLQIAAGYTLKHLGLGRTARPVPFPASTSIQVRINAERFLSEGNVVPTSGKLLAFAIPSGPGIRVDTSAHAPLNAGRLVYQQTPLFDSLLAKAIFTAPSYGLAVQMVQAGLAQIVIAGVECNVPFLRALLQHNAVQNNHGVHTLFVEEHFAELFAASQTIVSNDEQSSSDLNDPSPDEHSKQTIPEGLKGVPSPLSGLVTQILVKEGQSVRAGDEVALLESMKMEHVVRASGAGTVKEILVHKGSTISEDAPLLLISPSERDGKEMEAGIKEEEEDVNQLRPDLHSLLEQRRLQSDGARVQAVQRRKAVGYLTARENVDLLVDEGSLIEWGDLTIAAQRTRTDEQELGAKTSNDGVMWVDDRVCFLILRSMSDTTSLVQYGVGHSECFFVRSIQDADTFVSPLCALYL